MSVQVKSVLDTIRRRRSIGKVTDQLPSREQIEEILEAATHAPNHHNVQPWRFFVLAGKAREELGQAMEQALRARLGDMPQERAESLLAKERNKLLRAPVIITVASEHSQESHVVDIENVEATAAAVQNMLLVAEEHGLTALWRTGDAAYDPAIKHWFGLSPDDHIVAFIYLGYPAIPRQERKPTPAHHKTTWLGW